MVVVEPRAEADDGVALHGPIWAERGLDRGWGFGGGAGAEGGTSAHTHLCPYTSTQTRNACLSQSASPELRVSPPPRACLSLSDGPPPRQRTRQYD
jgi:hypothetical protein